VQITSQSKNYARNTKPKKVAINRGEHGRIKVAENKRKKLRGVEEKLGFQEKGSYGLLLHVRTRDKSRGKEANPSYQELNQKLCT
jgi:hypothetical protein